MQLGGRAFITGTVVHGRIWLRACIVNHRATEADVDATVDAVLEAATQAGPPPRGGGGPAARPPEGRPARGAAPGWC